jgi:hypothetical protein
MEMSCTLSPSSFRHDTGQAITRRQEEAKSNDDRPDMSYTFSFSSSDQIYANPGITEKKYSCLTEQGNHIPFRSPPTNKSKTNDKNVIEANGDSVDTTHAEWHRWVTFVLSETGWEKYDTVANHNVNAMYLRLDEVEKTLFMSNTSRTQFEKDNEGNEIHSVNTERVLRHWILAPPQPDIRKVDGGKLCSYPEYSFHWFKIRGWKPLGAYGSPIRPQNDWLTVLDSMKRDLYRLQRRLKRQCPTELQSMQKRQMDLADTRISLVLKDFWTK